MRAHSPFLAGHSALILAAEGYKVDEVEDPPIQSPHLPLSPRRRETRDFHKDTKMVATPVSLGNVGAHPSLLRPLGVGARPSSATALESIVGGALRLAACTTKLRSPRSKPL